MKLAASMVVAGCAAFACGARSPASVPVSHDDEPKSEKGDAAPPESTVEAGLPIGADAAALDGPVAVGELTCADVGKLPGVSDCCNGQYCAGVCWQGMCRCGNVIGGCIQPLCCKGLNHGCGGGDWCSR